MDLIKMLESLEKYGVDVLFSAVIVCLLTQTIKVIFQNKINENNKKYFTFLPFVLGIVVLTCVSFATNAGFVFSADTIYRGFECGLVSTTIYVLYEQFVKAK